MSLFDNLILLNRNLKYKPVIGPLYQRISGLKTSSFTPYAYFSQRAISSKTVSDTPSLNPSLW